MEIPVYFFRVTYNEKKDVDILQDSICSNLILIKRLMFVILKHLNNTCKIESICISRIELKSKLQTKNLTTYSSDLCFCSFVAGIISLQYYIESKTDLIE